MLIYILFLIGFIFLIKGADFLVDGAASIAKKYRVSNLIIGLTIVAFGTSAPELIVNIYASIQGTTDIAIGNVLGSNIFNILIVLGFSAIIYPLIITKNTVYKEIPISLISIILLAFLVNIKNLFFRNQNPSLSSIDGFILIILFIIFLYYIILTAKKQRNDFNTSFKKTTENYGVLKSVFYIIIGLIGINIGAKWVVDGAVELALSLNVSQSLIALTIIAMGTSLPELVTSCVAAFKKNSDIAVGNIIGSNIFNILWILGISSLIRPLPFKTEFNFDIAVVIVATILLFLTMFTGRKKYLLERWEGIIFIVIYICYLAYLIIKI